MRNKFTMLIFMMLLAAMPLVYSSCSTPESRMKENPELFASFPPDVQQNVRNGKIDIGYTKDMVRMALGDPDRESKRVSATGAIDIWSYVDTYTTTEQRKVVPAYYDADEGKNKYRDMSYTTSESHEFIKTRVEFQGGKVINIEYNQR